MAMSFQTVMLHWKMPASTAALSCSAPSGMPGREVTIAIGLNPTGTCTKALRRQAKGFTVAVRPRAVL